MRSVFKLKIVYEKIKQPGGGNNPAIRLNFLT